MYLKVLITCVEPLHSNVAFVDVTQTTRLSDFALDIKFNNKNNEFCHTITKLIVYKSLFTDKLWWLMYSTLALGNHQGPNFS